MSAAPPSDVTELLLAWRGGDDTALQRLIPLVYRELRNVARQCLRHEYRGQALQTTELVNEAFLRLVGASRVQWRDRAHFFAMAATLMRRALIDEARNRNLQKHGGEFVRVTLDDDVISAEPDFDLMALAEVVERLAEFAPRKAKVVDLRFFGGLTIDETASFLNVSPTVVKREWRTARLWLLRAFREGRHGSAALEHD